MFKQSARDAGARKRTNMMQSGEQSSKQSNSRSRPMMSMIKTKAIERVLAPIASQVSQLIILNETIEKEGGKVPNLIPHAQAVLRATEDLVQTGQRMVQETDDEKLQEEMPGACDAAIAAGRSMLMAVQRFQIDPSNKPAQDNMVAAARRLLETTMMVLLISDAVEVRRILDNCDWVLETLQNVKEVRQIKDLLPAFKELSKSVLMLCERCDQRQQDLNDENRKEMIISALTGLKKAMPLLNSAMQTFVKYPTNVQAKASKDYACKQGVEAVHLIQQALQQASTRAQREENRTEDTPGHFSLTVGKLVELLSPNQRMDLSKEDFEGLLEQTVQHGMSVAAASREEIKDDIGYMCKQILHLKCDIVELSQTVRAKPSSSSKKQLMQSYQQACEQLAKDLLGLEGLVKSALIQQVVDVFAETTESLDRMVKVALIKLKEKEPLSEATCLKLLQPLDDSFHDHSDRIIQITAFMAASCTDSHRGHELLSLVSKLEELDSDVFPSCLAVRQDVTNKGALEHLKLVRREWHSCIQQLLDAVDDIIDITRFMEASVSCLESDVEDCRQAGNLGDVTLLSETASKLLGRCRRVLHVARQHRDRSDDAIYRNGLQVFIDHTENATTLVKNGAHYAKDSVDNKRAMSTLLGHCHHLLQCVNRLSEGLDEVNHPDIMNPLRSPQRSHERSLQYKHQETKGKVHRQPASKEEEFPGPRPRLDLDLAENLSKTFSHFSINHRSKSHNATAAVTQPAMSVLFQTTPPTSSGISVGSDQAERWPLPPRKITKDMIHKLDMAYPINELLRALFNGDLNQMRTLCKETKSKVERYLPLINRMKNLKLDQEKIRSLEGKLARLQECTLYLNSHAETCLHGDSGEMGDAVVRAEAWSSLMTEVISETNALIGWLGRPELQGDVVSSMKGDVMQLVGVAINVKETLLSMDEDNQPTHAMHLQQLRSRATDWTTLATSLQSKTNQLRINNEDRALVSESETLTLTWAIGLLELLHILDTMFMGHDAEERITMVTALRSGQESNVLVEVKEINTVCNHLTQLANKALSGSDVSRQMDVRHALTELEHATSQLAMASISMATRASQLDTPDAQLSLLKISLLQREWIIKNLVVKYQIDSMILDMMSPLDRLTGTALAAQQAQGSSKQQMLAEFKTQADGMCEAVTKLKHDCTVLLQGISHLPDKARIEGCIDTLSHIIPSVVTRLRQITDDSSDCTSDDMKSKKREWGCNAKAFINAVQGLPGVDITLKQEMKEMLLQEHYVGIDRSKTPVETHRSGSSRLEVNSPSVVLPQLSADQWRMIQLLTQQGSSLMHMQPGRATSPYHHGNNALYTPGQLNTTHHNSSLKVEAPKVTVEGSKAPSHNPAGQLYRNRTLGLDDTPRSLKLHSVSASSLQSVDSHSASLSETGSAIFSNSIKTAALALQQETDRWEEDKNEIVRVARIMAQQMKVLARFARRHSCTEEKEELICTAKSIAANGSVIVKFADILARNCMDKRFGEELELEARNIPVLSRQLSILASVKAATPDDPTSNAGLLKNAENLMAAVVRTLKAAEAACVKGLLTSGENAVGPDKDTEEAKALAMQWKRKLHRHRRIQASNEDMDHLGLRRIKKQVSAPSLTEIVMT